MDRFLSSAVNRIDAKGRVSVPAPFRAVVQKRGYQDLYALRALDVPALDVGGLEVDVEGASAGGDVAGAAGGTVWPGARLAGVPTSGFGGLATTC